MAQRRSLSPKTSTATRIELGRAPPTRLEDNLFDDFDAEPAGSGMDTSERDENNNRVVRPRRRGSMPLQMLSSKKKNNGEVMDPNAMRYLPKILRDTYAQRQTKRQSDLGEARLASIDLRLRLQRPESLP
eukprot:CAMPEP_0196149938 /NCGR_PEP_ID=MMETSP0910-20130528/30829_1 /TAXON_ID=49265 /ORGANISM="Thalassiosira rotula, Strain GSO102" /LENGTH=129 /DNA_ID=CAMNT_0041412957 /DNA_START=42 /DNA_END=427 /DNA_ORIENTATION=+